MHRLVHVLDRRVHPRRVLRDEHLGVLPPEAPPPRVRAAVASGRRSSSATVSSLAALVSGHRQAEAVAEHQPAKLAAFEGHFRDRDGRDRCTSSACRTSAAQTVRFGVAIPGMPELPRPRRLRRSRCRASTSFRPEDRPAGRASRSRPTTSWSALGMLFIGLTLLAAASCAGAGRSSRQRWLLWVFVFAVLRPVRRQPGRLGRRRGRPPAVDRRSSDGLLADAPPDAVSTSAVHRRRARCSAVDHRCSALIYLALVARLALRARTSKIQHGPDEPASCRHHAASGLDAAASLEAAARSCRATTGRRDRRPTATQDRRGGDDAMDL